MKKIVSTCILYPIRKRQDDGLEPAAITPEKPSRALTSSPSPLHLEALEVRLVLDNFHERHLSLLTELEVIFD